MLKVVHWDVNCDDEENITAIEVKIKVVSKDESLMRHLVTHVYNAFSNTTLLDDVGDGIEIQRNNERKDIVDLKVKLKKDDINTMTDEDAARFITALRKALNEVVRIKLS